MGFFDFLKDLDIKAPEQEPQRGTLIQTDKSGRIETDQIGTPIRPQSRIVSRDEFRDRQPPPDINMRKVEFDRPPPDINLRRVEPDRSGIQSFGSQVLSPQRNLFEERLDRDLGNPLSKLDQIVLGRGNIDSLGLNRGNPFIGANYPTDRIRNIALQSGARQVVPNKTYDQIIQEVTDEFPNNPPEVNMRIAQDMFTQQQGGDTSSVVSADLNENTERNIFKNYMSDLGEGRLGGNMVGTASQVPAFTTQAYTGSQPNQGITSFADAKKEIIQGKQEGIKQLSPLQKIMAPIRNFFGRAMNYETDAQGRLTMKGIADMEADKQRSQAIYAENQRQRNLDRDRAMRMAQTQQQPVAQPPVQEEGIKNLFERNPESLQAYLNRFRPPNIIGNVPLTMYGQVGGEYDFFKRAEGGQALQKQPTGEVVGVGGPKDDLVGPILLSNKEYVLPHEQIKMYGGGDYETGVKRLEQDRMNALTNFA